MAEEHVYLDLAKVEVRTEDELEEVSPGLAELQGSGHLDVGVDHEEGVGGPGMVQRADEIGDRVVEAITVSAQNDSASDSDANHLSFCTENCSMSGSSSYEESDSESDREREESSSDSGDSVHFAREIVADFAAERRRAQWEWQRLQEMFGDNVEDEDNLGGAMRGGEEPAEEGRREGRRRRRQWVRVKRVDCRGKMCFLRRKRNGTRSRRIDSRSRKKKWTGVVN
ncbi:hypothetical protein PoB_007633000 [Plakobranchus ocellatus]|uniref:Uncharacterized protein n=1 Tax=Plakobranchus ocellatus TaxID=259542 RepID=A0AAV4E0A4_9GAST|nr:hypothetical protein PoB_007633000 [Plakobranchus ocellatus]